MSLYTSHQRAAGLLSGIFEQIVAFYLRPRVSGAENLPLRGAFMLAANHASHADTAVIYASVPRALRRRLLAAAAQDYFFEGGLRQYLARALFNAIPVDRESAKRRDPLRHVVRALREGYGVLIYPEGTRSRDGRIGPFRSGIGRLAAQFPDAPVIPALLEGTSEVMPKGRPVPLPHRVCVTFGAPLRLEADRTQKATWQAAANQVREAIVGLRAASAPEGEEEVGNE
jgi:1-acyl-sn-glycerol-3-phosphate acyltransferase